MRRVSVLMNGNQAGVLSEENAQHYVFDYDDSYQGIPVSLTMPIENRHFEYDSFPPFFAGLLPEEFMLHSMLKKTKIAPNDYMSMMIQVGAELVGAVTIKSIAL